MGELLQLQTSFTQHLRNPDETPVPAGLNKRRMGVYSELIFNNLSGLLAGFFPVIKSILPSNQWDGMVRDYFISHQSQTPYFPRIAGEFVTYLTHRQLSNDLPGFLVELGHYEWMELELYILDVDPPAQPIDNARLHNTPLALSPLAAPLAYNYPVHHISPDFQPPAPSDAPVYLLVLRDGSESVRFFELQPLSFKLLHDMQENPGLVAGDWLDQAARQMKVKDKAQFVRHGVALLASFNENLAFIET